MGRPLNPDQRRHLRKEVTVATLACSLLPTGLIAALFEGPPVPLLGAEGLVAFAMKSTTVAVLLMTLLMTLGVRAKMRQGALSAWQGPRQGWLAWVPLALWLRVPLFAVAAALVAAAITALWGGMAAWSPFARIPFLAYNLGLGALIGLVMTPLIQMAALADGAARAIPGDQVQAA